MPAMRGRCCWYWSCSSWWAQLLFCCRRRCETSMPASDLNGNAPHRLRAVRPASRRSTDKNRQGDLPVGQFSGSRAAHRATRRPKTPCALVRISRANSKRFGSSSRRARNNLLFVFRNCCLPCVHPVPPRGVGHRRKRGTGSDGRSSARDERAVADGEIVWVRRPGAGVK